jgi:hypothetical protein
MPRRGPNEELPQTGHASKRSRDSAPPTYLAWRYDWGLYWAWTFASLYVILLALIDFARFLQGRWKEMRVIEQPGLAVDLDGVGLDGVAEKAPGLPRSPHVQANREGVSAGP